WRADFVALAAARLVNLVGADEDDRIVVGGGHAVDQPLGAAGLLPAADTDGVQLVYVLGPRQQNGHRAKGHAPEIRVQSGADHSPAAIGQHLTQLDNAVVKKLNFVDGDYRRFRRQQGSDLRGVIDGVGLEVQAVVAGDPRPMITIVDAWLKDLDLLLGNDGTAQAADQLLRLAAE